MWASLIISDFILADVLGVQVSKVGVLEGLLHGDAPGRVQGQHFHAQVQAQLVEILEVGLWVGTSELGEGRLKIWQLVDIGPLVLGWGAVELEDLEDLVDFGVAIEHGSLLDQLCKNAADSPDIDTQTVLLLAEQHLRRPVPQSFNLMSESLDRNAKSPSQPEISNLEIAGTIDQQVLRLQVAVDDPPGVAVVDPVDQLVQEQLNLVRGDCQFVLRQILFQIIVQKFEYQVQFFLAGNVDDFVEAVSIIQYLTMLGWGCSSFRIEISLMAVEGTPSSSFSSFIFFSATVWLRTVSLALKTTPQVPSPMRSRRSYFSRRSSINCFIQIQLQAKLAVSLKKSSLPFQNVIGLTSTTKPHTQHKPGPANRDMIFRLPSRTQDILQISRHLNNILAITRCYHHRYLNPGPTACNQVYNPHIQTPMKYVSQDVASSEGSMANKANIDWNEFNYPICLKLFHYNPTETPDIHRRRVGLLRATHTLIIVANFMNIIANIAGAAQGVENGGLRIGISFFLFFFWIPPAFYYLFYPYHIIMKQEGKPIVFYVLAVVVLVWFGIWCIADFADANGFVMVGKNFMAGRGAAGFFGLATSIPMLVIALMSAINVWMFYRR